MFRYATVRRNGGIAGKRRFRSANRFRNRFIFLVFLQPVRLLFGAPKKETFPATAYRIEKKAYFSPSTLRTFLLNASFSPPIRSSSFKR